jgi:hypothetical protein
VRPASCGLGLPEYAVFGTNEVTGPEAAVLKLDSFHGPSTTPQMGLVA